MTCRSTTSLICMKTFTKTFLLFRSSKAKRHRRRSSPVVTLQRPLKPMYLRQVEEFRSGLWPFMGSHVLQWTRNYEKFIMIGTINTSRVYHNWTGYYAVHYNYRQKKAYWLEYLLSVWL